MLFQLNVSAHFTLWFLCHKYADSQKRVGEGAMRTLKTRGIPSGGGVVGGPERSG